MSFTKDKIKPRKRERVIDLVKAAGVDVADWSNYDGPPAANPKYCYDWSFVQPGHVVVLNLWFDDITEDNGDLILRLNLRTRAASLKAAGGKDVWIRRNLKMDAAAHLAYAEELPVRVIVLDGERGAESNVSNRLLDEVGWAVTAYNSKTGDFVLTRGVSPVPIEGGLEDPELAGFEGELRRKFILHRHREAKLRKEKIEEALKANGGHLICEVPGCDFDFLERYGELGRGFAHVHHLLELSLLARTGQTVTLKDLAVVCANCHAMIHVGGECRELSDLIPHSSPTSMRKPGCHRS
ncbi:hypothetical protein IYX23_02895 [Methylocystis sp. L43]|uniref:HNH endonuclease n=1 Tax=unclassified Methylocystis TaxID=2625913 RepID=UPI0018C219C8|nr:MULTISPECIES: hypothetical protein [unclassified Methylocystis]MBG0796644.1 hypothetical protein [Methylocystis sp. L43]MBG0804637.1 hypothetical protein [Methylocystis sp. H15]